MECATSNNRIAETFKVVNTISHDVKPSQEESINKLLDRILELKQELKGKADGLGKICKKMHEVTWYKNLSDEELALLKKSVDMIRFIHHVEIRYYVHLGPIFKKGIAKEEAAIFKNALDDLKECTQDVEDRFFNLPNDKEFLDDLKELESL